MKKNTFIFQKLLKGCTAYMKDVRTTSRKFDPSSPVLGETTLLLLFGEDTTVIF